MQHYALGMAEVTACRTARSSFDRAAQTASCRRGLSGDGLAERALGLLGQGGKPCSVVNGQLGENLAIQFDPGQLQAVDKLRVADAAQLGGCTDTDNPERAKLALLLAAADVGKFETALYSFL